MEDKVLKDARTEIDSFVKYLKNKHGAGLMTTPDIKYDFDNNKYKISFLVDQRKIDLLKLIIQASKSFKKAQNNDVEFKSRQTIQENKIVYSLDFKE